MSREGDKIYRQGCTECGYLKEADSAWINCPNCGRVRRERTEQTDNRKLVSALYGYVMEINRKAEDNPAKFYGGREHQMRPKLYQAADAILDLTAKVQERDVEITRLHTVIDGQHKGIKDRDKEIERLRATIESTASMLEQFHMVQYYQLLPGLADEQAKHLRAALKGAE